MSQERLYHEKELSWLAFNERVLQEAADKRNPLIERMRFLGIYSNNLDEFYKVRFADVKRRILINEERGSASGARHLLKRIQNKVAKQDQEFDILYNDLLLEMARNQIFLINERQISPRQQIWLRQYFRQHLRQHITPILINPDTNLVEFLKDDYTYLAVEIINGGNVQYALLEIPLTRCLGLSICHRKCPNGANQWCLSTTFCAIPWMKSSRASLIMMN